MKLRLTKLFSLSIILLFAYSCKTECNHTDDGNESCYPNNEKPSQVITYNDMADMMDAYDNGAKKELNKYINQKSKGKDSISTEYNWYNIDDLKQYIAYIEKISKEKNWSFGYEKNLYRNIARLLLASKEKLATTERSCLADYNTHWWLGCRES